MKSKESLSVNIRYTVPQNCDLIRKIMITQWIYKTFKQPDMKWLGPLIYTGGDWAGSTGWCIRTSSPKVLSEKTLRGSASHIFMGQFFGSHWKPFYEGSSSLWNHPYLCSMGDLQDPIQSRYCTIFQAIFSGDIPWNLCLKNRPKIYGRYLQSIGSWNGHTFAVVLFFNPLNVAWSSLKTLWRPGSNHDSFYHFYTAKPPPVYSNVALENPWKSTIYFDDFPIYPTWLWLTWRTGSHGPFTEDFPSELKLHLWLGFSSSLC